MRSFQADAEANWIRASQPAVWRDIRHYLLLSGFLTHRLTGRFVDSIASQVGYIPFDYKRLAWAKSGDWRWTAAPVATSSSARTVTISSSAGPPITTPTMPR
jgi:sugar (pentulose or hexulose) kinase